MPTLQVAIDARGATTGAAAFGLATSSISAGALRAVKAVGALVGVIGALHAVRTAAVAMAEFEQAILRVKAVTRATGDDFAALSAEARRLGETTRFTAVEAADGLLFLARAGFSAKESIEALGPVLNFALGGFIQMGQAADIASNVLTQFGLATTDTERVVDTFINTANTANTNVLQMAEAFKLAGPVAASAGLSLEETAAAIGVLGNAGIQATLAGTGLRGTLAGLLAPTAKAKKIFKEFGISLDDVNPATNSLVEVFTTLGPVFEDAGNAFEIFGRRQAAAAVILRNNVVALRDLAEANETATRTSEKNAAIVDDSVVGAYKRMMSVLTELFLVMGDSGFIRVLREVIEGLTETIRVLIRATPIWKALAGAISFSLGFIGRSLLTLGSLAVITGILKLASALKVAAVAAATLNASAKGSLAALLAIGGVQLGSFAQKEGILQNVTDAVKGIREVIRREEFGSFITGVAQRALEIIVFLVQKATLKIAEFIGFVIKKVGEGLTKLNVLGLFDSFGQQWIAAGGILQGEATRQDIALTIDSMLALVDAATKDNKGFQIFENFIEGLKSLRKQAETTKKVVVELSKVGVPSVFIPVEFQLKPDVDFIKQLRAIVVQGSKEILSRGQAMETVEVQRRKFVDVTGTFGGGPPGPVPGLGASAVGLRPLAEIREELAKQEFESASKDIKKFNTNLIDALETSKLFSNSQTEIGSSVEQAAARIASLQRTFEEWQQDIDITTNELLRMDRAASMLGDDEPVSALVRVFRFFRRELESSVELYKELVKQNQLFVKQRTSEEIQKQAEASHKNFLEQEKVANALRGQFSATQGLQVAWDRFSATATSAGENMMAVFDTIERGLAGAMTAIIEGTASAADAFKSLARVVLQQLNIIIARLIVVAVIRAIAGFAGAASPSGATAARTETGGLSVSAAGASAPRGRQRGGTDIFSGPASGFRAPLILHGTERVRVTPVTGSAAEDRARDGGGGVTVLQTVNINAIDTQSFQQKFREGVGKDLEFLGNAVGSEIARRPTLKRSIREG